MYITDNSITDNRKKIISSIGCSEENHYDLVVIGIFVVYYMYVHAHTLQLSGCILFLLCMCICVYVYTYD